MLSSGQFNPSRTSRIRGLAIALCLSLAEARIALGAVELEGQIRGLGIPSHFPPLGKARAPPQLPLPD